jgi:hypothetical protein
MLVDACFGCCLLPDSGLSWCICSASCAGMLLGQLCLLPNMCLWLLVDLAGSVKYHSTLCPCIRVLCRLCGAAVLLQLPTAVGSAGGGGGGSAAHTAAVNTEEQHSLLL